MRKSILEEQLVEFKAEISDGWCTKPCQYNPVWQHLTLDGQKNQIIGVFLPLLLVNKAFRCEWCHHHGMWSFWNSQKLALAYNVLLSSFKSTFIFCFSMTASSSVALRASWWKKWRRHHSVLLVHTNSEGLERQLFIDGCQLLKWVILQRNVFRDSTWGLINRHQVRCTRNLHSKKSSTSRRAFCTVSWLYTLAPSSGTTARSSSLLREKSCAPVSTPRHDTVLRNSKHSRLELLQVHSSIFLSKTEL